MHTVEGTDGRAAGRMGDLTPEERRRQQRLTLETPRRRYGLDARVLFLLEDVVFGTSRTLPKFKAREVSAPAPYRAWEQAAAAALAVAHRHTGLAGRLHERMSEARAERHNEQWHLAVLDELIASWDVREGLHFRLLPQVVALGLYQLHLLLSIVDPARSYRLNADIEDNAEHEYAALVAEHPEWETTPFRSAFEREYGSYESVADLFRQIGYDERVHKERSLDRLSARRRG